jgi:hypothetical protein
MGITFRLLQIGQILCVIGLLGFFATLGFGFILVLPLFVIAAAMFLGSALFFWLGLTQSLIATTDVTDRRLLGTASCLPPIVFLIPGLAAAVVPNSKTVAEIALAISLPAYVAAMMLWLVFFRRVARHRNDPATAQRATVAIWLLNATIGLCTFAGSSPFWMPAMNAMFAGQFNLGAAIETFVWISWVIAALLGMVFTLDTKRLLTSLQSKPQTLPPVDDGIGWVDD